jgi:hypothetical protein
MERPMSNGNARSIADVRLGVVPQPGQTVRLTAKASPQFRNEPIEFLVTSPAQPSSVDVIQHRGVASATWILLTGWQLNARGQRFLLRREVPVRVSGVEVLKVGTLSDGRAWNPRPRRTGNGSE